MDTRRTLPEPLRGNETGTFTHHSVAVRLPEIAQRVIEENQLSATQADAVRALVEEIATGSIRPLTGSGPNQAEWHGYVAPHVGELWFDVPWFFAEYYFYRRILDATGYWESGVDPFRSQKELGLEQAMEPAGATLQTVDAAYARGVTTDFLLPQLMDAALWGNQVDLSLWPATDGTPPELDIHADRLLVDDRLRAVLILRDRHPPPIDIVVDNAGSELIADLLLADMLLRSDLASLVRLHAKAYPIFVSDATARDVAESTKRLAAHPNPHLRSAGERLRAEFAAARLEVFTHPYWVSPLGWRDRPADLDSLLGEAGLIIVKGDANYRRLLDDRHWEFTTSIADAVGPTPAPLLALRTLKSEVAAGLDTAMIDEAASADSEWLQNGRWAVAQFVPG